MDYSQRRQLQLFETYRYTLFEKANRYASRLSQAPNEQFLLEMALLYSHKALNCARTEQRLLDGSTLLMCDALRFRSGTILEMPPGPQWYQFLEPRSFRGREVLALCFSSPNSFELLETNRFLPLSPGTIRANAKRYLHAHQHEWTLEIIVEGDPPEHMAHLAEPGTEYLASTHILGTYDTRQGTWIMTTEHQCPTSRCAVEQLGEQEFVMGCASCMAELDEWSRWLATMLELLTGKFRKAQGNTHSQEVLRQRVQRTTPTLQGKRTLDKQERCSVSAQLVRYDISLFKPVRQGTTQHLSDTHTILTPEQAADSHRWDALIVDTSILVRDQAKVKEHWRYFQASRFKKVKTKVRPKEPRTQYITLSLWRRREEERARRKLEDLQAKAVVLVTAKAFTSREGDTL